MNKLTSLKPAFPFLAAFFSLCALANPQTQQDSKSGVVYRCVSDDGSLRYSSKVIEDAECATISYAAKENRWHLVTTAETGMTVSIDTKTMDRSKIPIVVFWAKFALPSTGEKKEYTLSRIKVSCDARASVTLEQIDYKADGTNSVQWVNPAPKMLSVAPDTVMEAILESVCKTPA
jgi:hypothetical protein